MGVLFFRLNQVPDDEADEVRAMLDDAQLAFYETQAGNWGVSLAAIWLVHEADMERAQALMADYQHQRAQHMHDQQQAEGVESFYQRARREPVKMIAYVCVALAILYLSIAPLFDAWS